MPEYSNGYIPDSLLVTFKTGWNSTDGNWKHQLSPSTYRKHLRLMQLAKARTGRTLEITEGWGAYRPYNIQVLARRMYGNGAAWPGTSSHGGFWERQQTLAMDYGNWGWVYDWDRGAFYADVRAAGLTPGMIHPSRGNNYPDEPWHVIDTDPWAAVPAGGNHTSLEDDMFEDKDRALLVEALTEIRNTKAGIWAGGPQSSKYGVLPIVTHNQTLIGKQTVQINALSAAVSALAASKGADPAAILKVVEDGVKAALKDVTFSVDVDG